MAELYSRTVFKIDGVVRDDILKASYEADNSPHYEFLPANGEWVVELHSGEVLTLAHHRFTCVTTV